MIKRRMHHVSTFVFAVWLVSAVFHGTRASATIYGEFNLGHGGRSGSGQFPISDAGWSAHFGPSAAPVPVPADPDDAPANWQAGWVRNFEALATDGRHPGNPLRESDVLLWTDNLQHRVAHEDVALLHFGQRNADAEIAPHPALRIEGQWYVTAEPFPQQSIRLTQRSLSASVWKPLRFVPEKQLSREADRPVRFDSLAGNVDGIGLFYPAGSIRGRIRLQSTELLTQAGLQRRRYRDNLILPTVDLSDKPERHHTIVAQGTERYWQGHPSTVLMPDGRTIFCVWQGRRDGSRAHGAPAGYLKRSDDGGLTWSDELEVPANWLEIGRGHPTIHRLVDPEGVARLFVFCRDASRSTFLQAVSEDEGQTWSEMRPIGLIDPEGEPITGWTAPISILEATGPAGRRRHLMWYEKARDGRPSVGVIWQSASYDGGLTWGESKPVVDRAGASEPGAVRSPDGKQLLLLIREQQRQLNSLFSVSDDEGESWSEPQELPLALTGDRHNARYAPDGRLVIAFRPLRPRTGRTWGQMIDSHFTAWVGSYEDILEGREGQYRIKLAHSHAGADHTYPGLEVLADGSLVATTYIQYRPDELHSVVSARFKLEETDEIYAKGRTFRDTITLPTVDLSDKPEQHHTIVAQGTERYWQGHPSTVLMPDGRTIFCVWQGRRDGSRAHGAPAGYLKRSDDGGLTWSDELEVPANWLEIGRGHPTIHRLVDPEGVARLFVFCRDANRSTFLQAVSEDEGQTWSEMRPIGLIDPEGEPITGWTAPISILEATGPAGRRRHLMWYEKARDGRPSVGVIWQSASYDGGLTWGESKPVVDRAGASEPGAVRSPDGKQLLLLIRENRRKINSLFSVSDDEGETWSEPQELPLALTGDRHNARYAPDGRLVIPFRPVFPRPLGPIESGSHFTAWVGRYEDIVEGREGQYLLKLIHSHAGTDHTYPGLEVLPDGSLVATTYIKYRPGAELHSVVSCRFHLEQTDILWEALQSETEAANARVPTAWGPR